MSKMRKEKRDKTEKKEKDKDESAEREVQRELDALLGVAPDAADSGGKVAQGEQPEDAGIAILAMSAAAADQPEQGASLFE
eukprot:CAMPEP_0195063550 /NCGR_PEP_ID=MMETSP0448-20130528/9896_1 /TAXON_ID=66468 /ORGANISM="Heterocapsa triquestra, Strain CCMP 448" /LENGTH=80 /DNA_ID=CAMNT_0040094457 /DNA_START=38 /DNA_END=277 /DNA_ORIENTATION=+